MSQPGGGGGGEIKWETLNCEKFLEFHVVMYT